MGLLFCPSASAHPPPLSPPATTTQSLPCICVQHACRSFTSKYHPCFVPCTFCRPATATSVLTILACSCSYQTSMPSSWCPCWQPSCPSPTPPLDGCQQWQKARQQPSAMPSWGVPPLRSWASSMAWEQWCLPMVATVSCWRFR